MPRSDVPVALTIAGSDSGGGAGIQADLKTFTVLGVFGTTALTALTAQNTRGVQDIHPVPPAFVTAQIDSVAADLPPAAAKTGMLFSPELIAAVAEAVHRHRLPNLVVDPVMVAASGARLIQPEAERALVSELFPLARLVTPNLAEASLLADRRLDAEDLAALREAAKAIHDLGAPAVVVKGGRDGADSVDVLFDGSKFHEFREPTVPTTATHGTGCTFSAALAAGLAWGLDLCPALAQAKRFVALALTHAPRLGHGVGPINHTAWLRRTD